MPLINKRKKNASGKNNDTSRENSEKYRTFLDNASDAILIADTKGNILEANKKAENLFGYSRKELLESNISKIHPAGNFDNIKKLFLKIKQGKSETAPDVEVLKKDGTISFVDITGSVIEYGGKKVLQGIFRDITERKIMEDSLRKSEQRYRDILETMREGYFELDLEGNYTFVNEANCRFLGYAKEELIGKNFRIHTTKEAAEKVIGPYRELYKTGKPIESLDLESFTKDGRKVIYETSVSLIKDDKGEPVGFRGISRDVTARKQMEEELRKSEEKYRTILESIDDGYYEIDLKGNYTFFNDAEAKNLGYTKEEMWGVNSRKYQDEETYKRTFKAFAELYRTGEPIKALEMEAIRKDGSKVFNEISASLIRDQQGKPIGFRGITRNISQRKHAEEVLKQSEQKYRFLTESMTDIIWIAGLDLRTTYVTPSIQRLLGFTQEERIKQSLDQQLTPESLALVFDTFNRELALEKQGGADPSRRVDLQLEYYHKDGSTRWLEVAISGIRDNQDVLTGIYGVARDVTERKKVEQALYESEEKYRTILEKMDEGYFEMDLRGHITFFNQPLCSLLGYSSAELQGMSYKKYYDKETQQKIFKVYNQTYRTGEPGKLYGYEIIRKDGSKRFLESSVLLKRNSSGNPIGFRGLLRDITEQKLVEDEIKRNRDDLIKKNKEVEESRKNLQLTLEKLEAAYEELKTSQAKILQQEKMASIGQLAAGVAHEINNPVAFISSNLGTLEKYIKRLTDFIAAQSQAVNQLKDKNVIDSLGEKRKDLKIDYTISDAQKLLEESLDGTDRVQKIVQRLNRFSRVDDADYLKTDINECIDQSINIVWNELKYKGDLHRDYGILSPTKCYPQQLSQVFINLLLNAAQAISEKGEIKITTREKNKEIWISISDTGAGISEDNKRKIFEPFFTTKAVGKGTGLGLSISYEIIQRHKGEILFESGQGQGTTFTVKFPIVL